MATILENEAAWSTTASTNANVDTGINWAENQDAASVNNSARGMMAARAKARLDLGGGLVAGGAADALTVTTNQVLSAAHLAAGLRLAVRAIADNTIAAVTLAVDGLPPAPIKRNDGSALAAGSIKSGAMLDLVYNAGSSEWRAVTIPPLQAQQPQQPPITRLFSASTTYTPSAGMIRAVIECIGGGGGGGGAANSTANSQGGAGGGGGGAYTRVTVTAAQVGASQVVTIGTGGAGGANTGGNGGNGGTTSVGSLCTAGGGTGVVGATSNASSPGGSGGIPGIGDLLISGQNGSDGRSASTITFIGPSGGGGSSGLAFGAGAPAQTGTLIGTGGGSYGGGGGGGGSINAGGGRAGGAGAQGLVIIVEFC